MKQTRVVERCGRRSVCARAGLGWLLATALGLAAQGVAAQAPPRQFLHGHVPPEAALLQPTGRLPASARLSLAIGLPLRNGDALTSLLAQLYDPASPLYHQWLTPEQFTASFGPTAQDYQAVIDFAKANGLTVTCLHPNRVVLDVAGTASDIERVLHVTMRVYQHPKEARTFYAPDVEPSLDLAVPVLHISGLDDYTLPHPKIKEMPAGRTGQATANSGSGPGGAYRGGDFRAAYVPGLTNLTGTGQSVGLLQFDGYYASDITSYETQAGLPNVTLVNVPVDGGVSKPGSGNDEVSLDIEMVISMAPGVSSVYVYEAPNPSPWVDLLSRMANDNLAKQLSCSWGGGSPDATSEQVFKQMGAQGQSFFNATGDSDAFTSSIAFPSDSTNITQVGGTTLTTTGAGGAYVSETVWNWGSGVGSSGGVSTYYGIPGYQLGISMTANQGSTTLRNVPDVALTGDNVYVVYNNGGSGTFGGTSCATPLWAGFTALVNQQAVANGLPTVGFLNPALYAIGKGSSYTSDFHDITTGNNFSSSSPTKYSAVAGYDLCTGWGTPNGPNLINALAPPSNIPIIASAGAALVLESCSPTNGVIDPGETVTVNFTLQNNGGANTTNLVATLLASGGVLLPSGAQTYGVLGAHGGAATRSFTFTAGGVCGGTVTPALQLQDSGANLGTATFGLGLGRFVSTTTFAESFDGVTAPALPAGWTTTASGYQSPWVTSTTTKDTAPNAAFSAEASKAGVNQLVTPTLAIVSPSAQLSFRNNYNLEASSGSTAYDGGVLEIKIGSGSFTDILAAGGSFASGGYNRTISSRYSNPLAGRQAWSGSSGGFITTVVNLPAAAAGQNIQLQWRCGTDSSVNGSGWYIDTVSLTDGYYACCGDNADLAITQTVSPVPATIGQPVTFTLTVTNLGPQAAYGLTLTDALPSSVTFSSASAGCTYAGGKVFCAFNSLPSSRSTNVTITATPAAGGTMTNTATITAVTPDSNPANNTTIFLAPATVNTAPAITTQPTNVTAVAGANASFQVVASGTSPLAYRWAFNGTPLAGSTASILALTNVQLGSAGSYGVVVTNIAGSATSAPATLRVLVSPEIASLGISAPGVSLSFPSVTGLVYTLEYKNSLTDSVWTLLPPPATGSVGVLTLRDTNAPGLMRFYRVRCQ